MSAPIVKEEIVDAEAAVAEETKNANDSGDGEANTIECDETTIDCQICQKRFSDTSLFFAHWQKHSPVPYIKPYTCEICGKSYIANYFLIQHNQTHLADGSYDDVAVQEVEIEQEENTTNTPEIEVEEVISYVQDEDDSSGPTQFVCDICKTTYPDEMTLRRHSLVHAKKRITTYTIEDPLGGNRAYRRKDVVVGENGKNYEKPSCSYATLIAMAIRANNNKITLLDIYSWIMENFPYYKNTTRNWQNSIRHTLSLHPYFVRIPRAEPGARSGFWTIDERVLKEGRKYRRNETFRWASGDANASLGSNDSIVIEEPVEENLLVHKVTRRSNLYLHDS